MKSFLSLVLILFFFVCISKQQISVSSLYAEFNKIRSQYCLGAFTISTSLESLALTNATNKCNVSNNVVITNGYTSISAGSAPILNTTAITNANNSFYNSFNKWSCATDSSTTSIVTDPMFARFVLVPNQVLGCAFSNGSPCQYKVASTGQIYPYAIYYVCLFTTYVPPGTRIFPVSNCTCTSTTPTTAPSTTTPTTTPSTTTPTTTPSTTTPTTAQSTTTPTTAQSTTTPTTNPTTVSNWLVPHNNARSCVNITPFTWDETLANDAKNYSLTLAATCGGLVHSTSPTRNPSEQGENLFSVNYGSSSAFSESAFIATSVEGWVKENGNYSCLSNTCSLSPSNWYLATLSNGMKLNLTACGHYTQIIWKNSLRIGCGYSKCPNSNGYYAVCRYSPPGNYVSQHPLGGTTNCANCAAINRALTPVSGSSQSTSSTSQTSANNEFFKSDSQIYVFALTIVILVVVISIFVVILLNFIRSRRNPSDDYQLLETK